MEGLWIHQADGGDALQFCLPNHTENERNFGRWGRRSPLAPLNPPMHVYNDYVFTFISSVLTALQEGCKISLWMSFQSDDCLVSIEKKTTFVSYSPRN